MIPEGRFSSRFLMVDLALIYISPNAAGLRVGRLKGYSGYKRGLPFFGNARFCAIGAGAPAIVLSRYAMDYPKNAFF